MNAFLNYELAGWAGVTRRNETQPNQPYQSYQYQSSMSIAVPVPKAVIIFRPGPLAVPVAGGFPVPKAS